MSVSRLSSSCRHTDSKARCIQYNVHSLQMLCICLYSPCWGRHGNIWSIQKICWNLWTTV